MNKNKGIRAAILLGACRLTQIQVFAESKGKHGFRGILHIAVISGHGSACRSGACAQRAAGQCTLATRRYGPIKKLCCGIFPGNMEIVHFVPQFSPHTGRSVQMKASVQSPKIFLKNSGSPGSAAGRFSGMWT
jgi:hypothetical protein